MITTNRPAVLLVEDEALVRMVGADILTEAGFTIEIEDARSYRSPSPEVAPETQLFFIARRS